MTRSRNQRGVRLLMCFGKQVKQTIPRRCPPNSSHRQKPIPASSGDGFRRYHGGQRQGARQLGSSANAASFAIYFGGPYLPFLPPVTSYSLPVTSMLF